MVGILETLSTQTYFGNTLIQYILFLATVGFFIVLGKIASYFISKNLKVITAKTKTKMDNLLIEMAEKPVFLAFVIMGLAAGFPFLASTPLVESVYYNTINVLVVFLIAWAAIKFVDGVVRKMLHPIVKKTDSKLDDQLIPVIAKIAKAGIAVLAFIVVISGFGYDVTAILAGLGIGGLAFAFAAKETIADVFGGFSIFTSRPFVVGNIIEVDKIVGKVEEVGLRHTRIRNFEKRIVVIPNSKLANSVIINLSSAPKRKCSWSIGVTYNTSLKKLEKAKQIITEAITSNPECEDSPIVEFEGFGESSLKILVIFYTKSNDFKNFVKARNDVGLKIKQGFEKAKIEFAFPTQTVWVKK